MRHLLTLLILTNISFCYAQTWRTVDMTAANVPFSHTRSNVPLHEMRAVWLTTIGGLDWPHSYASSPSSIERQQNELRGILDRLQHAGINTILIQTRVRATTIYPSDLEPWDGCLSGKPGVSPGYDALQFAIDECHRRGMQCHAWVVTIPVGKWNGAGCAQLRKKQSKLLRKIGDEGYLNPDLEATGDYIASICREITHRYDIDGIHLDYIRYPETWGRICPEGKQKRSNLERGRENITRIVQKVYDAVKREKQWVMLSCSPIGKYADLPRQRSGGWNARDAVAQDVDLWMRSGLMDAIFPMMYFRDKNFYPFAMDWQERSAGRIVAPGLGIYFMSPKEKNWPLADITREMYFLRQLGQGFCMFRSKFFTDDTKGIYDFTQGEFCPYPALVPPMTWYRFTVPDAPDYVGVRYDVENADGTLSQDVGTLFWGRGLDNSDGPYLRYNVYASIHHPVDTHDARNIIATGLTEQEIRVLKGYNYAVTAVDRYGNESAPRATPSKTKHIPITPRR